MKFIILALIVATQSAFAAVDWTKKNDRDIYDLMYLPNEKTKFVTADLNFPGNKTEKRVNDVKIADTETIGYGFDVQGGYTPITNLAVYLDIKYLFDSTTEYNNVGLPSYENSSSGLGDPTLSARYRVLQQETQMVNLDVIPRITIGTGDREVPGGVNDTSDGNNKIGGNVFGLEVQAGLKYSRLQFMAFMAYDKYGESKLKDLGEAESRSDFELGGQVQTFLFDDQWLLDGLLSFNSMSEYKEDTSSTTFLDYPKRTAIKFVPQVTYLWNEDLALFARWELTKFADYDAKEQDGSKVEYGEIGFSKISLIARYQF